MNIFKVAKKSKYESLFSLKYSTIFELFQRSKSWHSRPKLKSVWVALFASTRTTSSSLIPLSCCTPLCAAAQTPQSPWTEGQLCKECAKRKLCLRTCNVDGGRWVVVVGGRSYLILEPVWWKPQCAAAALLSFHCCSVARGLGRGAPRRAPSQQQEVKSWCRAFQVITANGYRRWRWRRFCWIVRGMLTPTAMWLKLSESFCGCNRCARHLGNFWAAAEQITTQQHSQKVKLSLQKWHGI